jgi:hypothetical protein
MMATHPYGNVNGQAGDGVVRVLTCDQMVT